MKTLVKLALLTLAWLPISLANAWAAPVAIGTYQGRGADLSVRGGAFATGNHGTNLLRVRNAANLQDARKLYVRFDLADLPKAAKNATDASLTLQLLPAEGNSPADKVWTFDVFGLKDGLAGESWDESAATWNDAPASDSQSPVALTPTDVAPLGSFTIVGKGSPGQKIVFSSPAMLKWMQSDSNGLATFIVTRREQGTGENDSVTHIFASKESSKFAAPILTVAFNNESLAMPAAMGAAPVAYPLPDAPVPAGSPHGNEIDEFWELDKKQLPPKNAVLFLGSSSVKLWDTLEQDFAEIPVINRGFGGSLIEESTRYADRIIFPYAPKMIVMFAGTNDLAYGGKNPQQVLQEYVDFVAKVREKLPDVRIVYFSISPTVQRWNLEANILETNYLIEKYCFENNSPLQKLNFVGTHSILLTPDNQPPASLLREDGLHLNAAGYKEFLSFVKPRVLALADLEGVERLQPPGRVRFGIGTTY